MRINTVMPLYSYLCRQTLVPLSDAAMKLRGLGWKGTFLWKCTFVFVFSVISGETAAWKSMTQLQYPHVRSVRNSLHYHAPLLVLWQPPFFAFSLSLMPKSHLSHFRSQLQYQCTWKHFTQLRQLNATYFTLVWYVVAYPRPKTSLFILTTTKNVKKR